MSLRDGPLGDIKPPLAWMAGVALIIALGAALAVFVGDRRGTARGQALVTTRRAADAVIGPVGGVLSAPIGWIRQVVDAGNDYVFAGTQNRALKRQLIEAGAWKDEAVALRNENARLRALLGVKTDPPIPMVFARTVIDARGPFANTRLADAGAERGVTEGNPVMSEHGLVGRVTGVGPRVSRIMLLTDAGSRTPVIVGANGRAILTGDGGANPSLAYLRTHDVLHAGDRVLTSGDGGVLPRGLPVGSAVMGLDGVWRVALDSDASPIDFVHILLFRDFSQLVAPGALAPAALPSTSTGAPDIIASPGPATAGRAPAAAGAGARR